MGKKKYKPQLIMARVRYSFWNYVLKSFVMQEVFATKCMNLSPTHENMYIFHKSDLKWAFSYVDAFKGFVYLRLS